MELKFRSHFLPTSISCFDFTDVIKAPSMCLSNRQKSPTEIFLRLVEIQSARKRVTTSFHFEFILPARFERFEPLIMPLSIRFATLTSSLIFLTNSIFYSHPVRDHNHKWDLIITQAYETKSFFFYVIFHPLIKSTIRSFCRGDSFDSNLFLGRQEHVYADNAIACAMCKRSFGKSIQ